MSAETIETPVEVPLFDHTIVRPMLPDFATAVRDHSPQKQTDDANETITDYRFQMDDGSLYDTKIFTPHRTVFDTPVVYTTPWCTDINGFNEVYGRELAVRGIRSIAISPEHAKGTGSVRHLGKISLAHDAYVQHVLLDELQQTEQIDTEAVMSIGYSRGALVGLGMQAYAARFERAMPYNDYIDPPLEHPVSFQEIRHKAFLSYVPREVGELAKSLLTHPPRDFGRLPRTIRLSPIFWAEQIATGVKLFGGEAAVFLDNLPTEARTHIIHYDKSLFNQAAYWQKRFLGSKNVEHTIEAGFHLTGTRRDVIGLLVGRVLHEQQRLAS